MKVTCPCGTEFEGRSSKARYCSDRCRKRKGKADAQVVDLPAHDAPQLGPVTLMTIAELQEAGRFDSALGQACIALAARLDRPGLDTGSAMASVAARLDDLLTKAKRGGKSAAAPDKLRDELAERRASRGA